MTVARVFRKPSLQQEDRMPVSSYEEAVGVLVFIRCDETIPDHAYDKMVKLVADIYWERDIKVRRDVHVASREITGAAWTR